MFDPGFKRGLSGWGSAWRGHQSSHYASSRDVDRLLRAAAQPASPLAGSSARAARRAFSGLMASRQAWGLVRGLSASLSRQQQQQQLLASQPSVAAAALGLPAAGACALWQRSMQLQAAQKATPAAETPAIDALLSDDGARMLLTPACIVDLLDRHIIVRGGACMRSGPRMHFPPPTTTHLMHAGPAGGQEGSCDRSQEPLEEDAAARHRPR